MGYEKGMEGRREEGGKGMQGQDVLDTLVQWGRRQGRWALDPEKEIESLFFYTRAASLLWLSLYLLGLETRYSCTMLPRTLTPTR